MSIRELGSPNEFELAFENTAGGVHAFLFHGGEAARRNGRFNGGCRNAHHLRLDHGPAAGALLAGGIENHIDNRRAGFGIIGGQHGGGDFDEIGIEPALVPFGEDLADGLGLHAQPIAQHAIDFGNHLHVGIFNAVVDGFDEMAGAIGAKPGAAGFALEFCRDGGENFFNPRIGLGRSAHHDGGAMAGALFAAGYAHADKGQAASFKLLEAAHGIPEIGVARVDDDVIFCHQLFQRGDLLIHRLAGLHHDDHRARRADAGNELFHGFCRNEIGAKISGGGHEGIGPGGGAVEHGDAVALFRNVKRKVGAHDAKANEADFSL